MVTVSLLALDEERTRHGGRARSPLRSLKWQSAHCYPEGWLSPSSPQTCERRRTGWKRGSARPGARDWAAGWRESSGREEGGRPAGGGAWPRCAALTRWHSDRWREPAAAATAER